MRRVVALAALMVVLTACGAKYDDQAQTPPAPSASPSPSPSPSPEPSPSAAPSQALVLAPCETTGKFQLAVENALSALGYAPVTADGKPSPDDCAAVKAFQTRYDIRPADGIAGPITNGVAQRLLASDTSSCDAPSWGTTACIDLTNQTTWVMRDGKVLLAPTVTRTGMKDFATPTGEYTVDWRSVKDWSKPYKVWLPYWQSFNNDIGFHETTTYIHNASIGSHGCVNLLPKDALLYWEHLDEGSGVNVFGHRSGT